MIDNHKYKNKKYKHKYLLLKNNFNNLFYGGMPSNNIFEYSKMIINYLFSWIMELSLNNSYSNNKKIIEEVLNNLPRLYNKFISTRIIISLKHINFVKSIIMLIYSNADTIIENMDTTDKIYTILDKLYYIIKSLIDNFNLELLKLLEGGEYVKLIVTHAEYSVTNTHKNEVFDLDINYGEWYQELYHMLKCIFDMSENKITTEHDILTTIKSHLSMFKNKYSGSYSGSYSGTYKGIYLILYQYLSHLYAYKNKKLQSAFSKLDVSTMFGINLTKSFTIISKFQNLYPEKDETLKSSISSDLDVIKSKTDHSSVTRIKYNFFGGAGLLYVKCPTTCRSLCIYSLKSLTFTCKNPIDSQFCPICLETIANRGEILDDNLVIVSSRLYHYHCIIKWDRVTTSDLATDDEKLNFLKIFKQQYNVPEDFTFDQLYALHEGDDDFTILSENLSTYYETSNYKKLRAFIIESLKEQKNLFEPLYRVSKIKNKIKNQETDKPITEPIQKLYNYFRTKLSDITNLHTTLFYSKETKSLEELLDAYKKLQFLEYSYDVLLKFLHNKLKISIIEDIIPPDRPIVPLAFIGIDKIPLDIILSQYEPNQPKVRLLPTEHPDIILERQHEQNQIRSRYESLISATNTIAELRRQLADTNTTLNDYVRMYNEMSAKLLIAVTKIENKDKNIQEISEKLNASQQKVDSLEDQINILKKELIDTNKDKHTCIEELHKLQALLPNLDKQSTDTTEYWAQPRSLSSSSTVPQSKPRQTSSKPVRQRGFQQSQSSIESQPSVKSHPLIEAQSSLTRLSLENRTRRQPFQLN